MCICADERGAQALRAMRTCRRQRRQRRRGGCGRCSRPCRPALLLASGEMLGDGLSPKDLPSAAFLACNLTTELLDLQERHGLQLVAGCVLEPALRLLERVLERCGDASSPGMLSGELIGECSRGIEEALCVLCRTVPDGPAPSRTWPDVDQRYAVACERLLRSEDLVCSSSHTRFLG